MKNTHQTQETYKTYAEINLDALEHNYRVIADAVRRGTPEVKLLCIVKADAYGHGVENCVPLLASLGVHSFGVSCIEEARAVRACAPAGSDILILGYTPPENAEELAADGYLQTVYSSEYAAMLSCAACRAGGTVRIHLKIDTGMNRIGFPSEDPVASAAAVRSAMRLPGLKPEGIFTHFANADATDAVSVITQHNRFLAVLDALGSDADALCVHCCNSAAALRFPDMRHDMVRAGIILYGLSPSRDFPLPVRLSPVMTFQTTVTHIHTLRAGESVSYGSCFTADRDRRIATLGVGYADGFLRAFSAGGAVLIKGRRAPILGRVCMDQCMVDIGDADVHVGDAAYIFDPSGQNIEALAETAQTISYELLCLVGKRVHRVINRREKELSNKNNG